MRMARKWSNNGPSSSSSLVTRIPTFSTLETFPKTSGIREGPRRLVQGGQLLFDTQAIVFLGTLQAWNRQHPWGPEPAGFLDISWRLDFTLDDIEKGIYGDIMGIPTTLGL